MTTDQLQSHFQAAMNFLDQGSLETASREAELAVDDFWKYGSLEVTRALPLYSMLRHATGVGGDVFKTLDDMPTEFSKNLLSEATLLYENHGDEASAKMLADVNRFLQRWGNEQPTFKERSTSPALVEDEKIAGLIAQIQQLDKDGKREIALEMTLQLANEYADRNCKRRAYGNFMQVLRKSKREDRTGLRIDALLDFGQFMSRLGKLEDAKRALRLAAGVAKKSREKQRFAQAVAALGVVLLHAGENESAWQRLKTADKMLSPWDLEADIVKEHLEAMKEKRSCDCPEVTDRLKVSDTDLE